MHINRVFMFTENGPQPRRGGVIRRVHGNL